MFYRRKARLTLLLLASLLLLAFLHWARWPSVRALLGLSVTCRESDAVVLAHLQRVQPRCLAWPRQNAFFVAQGTLQRNRRLLPDARCYLLALDGATARVLTVEGAPVHAPLLRIECHSQEQHRRPLRLLLPAVPLPALTAPRASLGDSDEPWDVLVIGLGGMTHRLWTAAMPQTAKLVGQEMRAGLVSRLQPMSAANDFDLMQLLRGDGRWITETFAHRGYKTQAAVLSHESQEPFSTPVPAGVNLSDYLEARSTLHSPGCIGSVSEASMALSWVREMMILYASQHRVLSLLHFSDLIFPSTKRMDVEFVSLLLEYLHFECFSRTALILYTLPDARSGFEPGTLIFHPPPRLKELSSFRWDMIRSALGVGDFFTPADLNRVLAFLASDQKPSVLAPIGKDKRTCANMRVESGVCRCQRLDG